MSEWIKKFAEEDPEMAARTIYTSFDCREDLWRLMDKLGGLGISKKDILNRALSEYFKKPIEEVVKDLTMERAKEMTLILPKPPEEKTSK